MAFGRKAALRKVHSAMTMVRFFSFFAPQMALPKKTGGEVLGVPTSIGKHRRGRPGRAGVDYRGQTGRQVRRRGVTAVTSCRRLIGLDRGEGATTVQSPEGRLR